MTLAEVKDGPIWILHNGCRLVDRIGKTRKGRVQVYLHGRDRAVWLPVSTMVKPQGGMTDVC